MKRLLSVFAVLCCTAICQGQGFLRLIDDKLVESVIMKGKKKVCVLRFNIENYEWEPAKGITVHTFFEEAETDDNGIAEFDSVTTFSGNVDYSLPTRSEDYNAKPCVKPYTKDVDTLYFSSDVNRLVVAQASVYGIRNVIDNEEKLSKPLQRIELVETLCGTYNEKYLFAPDAESYKQFFNGNLDFETFRDNADFLLLNPTDENINKWLQKEFSPDSQVVVLNDYSRSKLAVKIYEILGRNNELYDIYKAAIENNSLNREYMNIPDDMMTMAVEKHDTTVLRGLITRVAFDDSWAIGIGEDYNRKGEDLMLRGSLDDIEKYFDAAYVAFDCIADVDERESNVLYPLANRALLARKRNEPAADELWMNTLNRAIKIEHSIKNGTARRAWVEREIGKSYCYNTVDIQGEKALKFLDSAIKHYEEVCKTNLDVLDELEHTLYLKAGVYSHMGDKKKAIKTYKQEINVLDKLIKTDAKWSQNKARVEEVIQYLRQE